MIRQEIGRPQVYTRNVEVYAPAGLGSAERVRWYIEHLPDDQSKQSVWQVLLLLTIPFIVVGEISFALWMFARALEVILAR